MGVKGLFQFLKRFEREVSTTHYISGKYVGIDIFWFLHKSKGDFNKFQSFLLPIIKYAKEVYCVFDGNPSEEKRKLLNEQSKKRTEILKSIAEIETFLKYPFHRISREDKYIIESHLNQLKRQAWKIQPEYIQQVKDWLLTQKCKIYQAEGEADNLLVELEQSHKINIIITNDSDLLILGSKIILRPNTQMTATVYDSTYIQTILGLTVQQWKDFMYLCRHMKNTDVILAYSLISVYKDLEYIDQKYYALNQDYLISIDYANI
jgi:5'-3' exonuclease